MNEEKNLIDVNEAGHIVLDMVSSTEFDNILKNCAIQTDDFKQGAIFGASMAMSFINTKATKYVLKENKDMRREISNIIKEWKDKAGVKGIIQISANFSSSKDTIKICTDRPGLMIGFHGALVAEYKEKLKAICPKLEHIEFIETDSWYIK